jgi:hypothetical protein
MGRIAAIPFFHPKTGLIKKNKNKKSKGYFCDKVPTYLQNIFTNIDIKLKSKCTANKILDEKELGIPIMIVREDYLQDFKDFILSHPKYLSKFKDLKELMELFRPDSYCMYYLHIPDESQGRPFLESRFCPSNEEVEIFQKIDNYVETIKEGIYPYLEEWVGTVINLAAEYVMFKLKFPAIFFNCEECFRPGLFIKRPNYCIEKESIEGQKLWGTANIVDVLIYTSAEKYGFDNDDKKNNVKLIKTNLIYHDESFFQRKDEIYCDCEFFQRHINGAFIMTVDINSITLAMDEIKKKGEEEQFDLIVTGSTSVKILKLFEKKNFLKYIKNIFIFAYFVDKYTYLKDEYPKVKEICFAKGEIIEYLENLNENKPLYKLTNLITYDDYKYKYHILHKMIAEQYGKYTEDCYNAAISVIQDFLYWSPQLLVQPNDSFDETKIQTLIKTLQNFKDISFNESHLIKIYSQTTGSFYNDFNNWLKELDPFAYKKIALFIASLMAKLVMSQKVISSVWAIIILIALGAVFRYLHVALPWTLSTVPYATALILIGSYASTRVVFKNNAISFFVGFVLTLVVSHFWRLDMAANQIVPVIPLTVGALSGTMMLLCFSKLIEKYSSLVTMALSIIGRETYVVMAFSQIIILCLNHYTTWGSALRYAVLIMILFIITILKNIVNHLIGKKYYN